MTDDLLKAVRMFTADHRHKLYPAYSPTMITVRMGPAFREKVNLAAEQLGMSVNDMALALLDLCVGECEKEACDIEAIVAEVKSA